MKCVYLIINLINNKKYIGSTCNYARRKREHLWMLRNNKHKNPHLQLAYNKYGEDNFIFSVLEKIEDNRTIYEVEQLYLDKYKTYNKKIGYNICREATSPNNEKSKKVIYQYSKEGIKLNTYNSIIEAANVLNCNYSGISNAASGKTRTAKGYVWIFENDFNEQLL